MVWDSSPGGEVCPGARVPPGEGLESPDDIRDDPLRGRSPGGQADARGRGGQPGGKSAAVSTQIVGVPVARQISARRRVFALLRPPITTMASTRLASSRASVWRVVVESQIVLKIRSSSTAQQPLGDRLQVLAGLRGLRGQADAADDLHAVEVRGAGDDEAREGGVVGQARDLGVVAVADDDDAVALVRAARLAVHLLDEGAGRVDDREPARLQLGVDARRGAVRAHDDDAGVDFGEARGAAQAALLERARRPAGCGSPGRATSRGRSGGQRLLDHPDGPLDPETEPRVAGDLDVRADRVRTSAIRW